MITWIAVLLAFIVFAVLTALLAWRVSKREKLVAGMFYFYDGHKRRCCDPITAFIALKDHPRFILHQHLMQALEGEYTARIITAEAVSDVFGIPNFMASGRPGLSVSEKVEMLNAFVVYLDLQKKSIRLPRILRPSMASISNASA